MFQFALVGVAWALADVAGLQTASNQVALLGGEKIDAFGKSSTTSGGMLFDLNTQTFATLADSGIDRSSHSVVESNGIWYIFGGASSDVQTYDPKTATFGVVRATNAPAPRIGHTAVAHKRTMYVLGGQLADGTYDAALRLFDLDTGLWTEMPSPIGGVIEHTAVTHDGLMWVFGGLSSDGNVLGSLWTFDFESLLWAQSSDAGDEQSAPVGRFGHAAAMIGDEMLIFGGQLRAEGRAVNDVWALHAVARERALPSWQRAAIVDGATAPAPRVGSVVAVYDNALWVFGGRGAGETFLDVWALDLEYLQWELIACLPGGAFPHCREAAIKSEPPLEQALTAFRFVSPGVSEASYSVQLHSAPTAPVRIVLDVDAGHVQLSPAELVFDESNWNQPQTVRVLVLEDLFLPGDSGELTITHQTLTQDAHYKRAVLAPRPVSLPSVCGDGRCLGDENYVNCAIDCRDSVATPFCGDGLCHEETYQSCPDDCAVQGSDNSCPADAPVRCRSGDCVMLAAACATRAATTATACGDDLACQGAVLACPDDSDSDDDDDDDDATVLCPDGSCARSPNACAPLAPCDAGLKRCFDTSCQPTCGAATQRCPPARPHLNLLTQRCHDAPDAEVPIEAAQRDWATLTTVARHEHTSSFVWLLAGDAEQYYGQLAFPGGALDGASESTCPCGVDGAQDDAWRDPLFAVQVVVLDDASLPNNSFAAFSLVLPSWAPTSFAPHVASVWVSHQRTDIDNYCLGAKSGNGSWWCIDEALQTSSVDAGCACTIKHTRGVFGQNYGSFAYIRDNCPGVTNPDQADADQDGVGDACDACPYSAGTTSCLISCDDGDINGNYVQDLAREFNVPMDNFTCPSSPYI